MDASKNLWQINDKLPCLDELIPFEKMICNGSTIFSEKTGRDSDQKEVEGKYCLIAKDLVKLSKCGNGWRRTENDGSSCACFQKEGNASSSHASNGNHGKSPCEGSFVYMGDLLSSARSVKLSPYRPRWAFLLIADLPYILENSLSSLLHVSAALAVVNCLPVSLSHTESSDGPSVHCNLLVTFALLSLEANSITMNRFIFWMGSDFGD